MVVIVTGYMPFLTSQYDVIFPFANHRFAEVCWRNMHIILHALSLLVVVQFDTVLNINYQRSKLQDRSKIKHSTLKQSNYNNFKNIRQRVKTREQNTLTGTSAQFTTAKSVAQPEWGRRGRAPSRNKLSKIFTGEFCHFQLLERRQWLMSWLTGLSRTKFLAAILLET